MAERRSKKDNLKLSKSGPTLKKSENGTELHFTLNIKGKDITFELRDKSLMYVDLDDIKEEDSKTDEDSETESETESESESEEKIKHSDSDDNSEEDSDFSDEDSEEDSYETNSEDELYSGFTTLNLFHNAPKRIYDNSKVLNAVIDLVGKFIFDTYGVKVTFEWADSDRQGRNICNFEVFQDESEIKNVEMIKKSNYVTTNLEEFWFPHFKEQSKK